jgi:hypothetical protein
MQRASARVPLSYIGSKSVQISDLSLRLLVFCDEPKQWHEK